MNNNKLSEGAACLICPNFLAGDAKEAYENNFELPEEEGGFNSWPEAVQFFLKSYAKDRHIEEALASLEGIKQKPDEKESAYAKRLRTQARRCGGVFNEPEMITRFIRGLHEDLKPLLRLTRADYFLPNVFQDFVERATAQGEAHRALAHRENKAPRSKEGAMAPLLKSSRPTQGGVLGRGPQVYNVDLVVENGDDLPYCPPGTIPTQVDPIMATHPIAPGQSDVPTAELDFSEDIGSDSYESCPSEVYLIHSNRKPRQPYYAQPTPHQRPGWMAFRNEPTDICFECFAIGHKKPNCPSLAKTFYDANFQEVVRRNYFKLTRQQREYLRAIGRTPAFSLTNDGASLPPTSAATTATPPSSVETPTHTFGRGPAGGSVHQQTPQKGVAFQKPKAPLQSKN